MKVFVDDLRLLPDNTWTLARTNTEAIRLLATGHVEVISIDHDICVPNIEFLPKSVRKRLRIGEETFQPVVYYIAAMKPEDRPKTIRIHTANPAGGMRMAGILRDVGVECEVKESSCPFDGLEERDDVCNCDRKCCTYRDPEYHNVKCCVCSKPWSNESL